MIRAQESSPTNLSKYTSSAYNALDERKFKHAVSFQEHVLTYENSKRCSAKFAQVATVREFTCW